MNLAPIIALAALVPVLIGPLPDEAATLTAKLCGGGEISIPLGKESDDTPESHPKACHAGNVRERSTRGN